MASCAEPIVETQLGKVRGAVERTRFNFECFAFKGIPYAKPPVGPLRFQDPEPIEPWTGMLDATKHGPISCQIDFLTQEIIGEDDCLYLNVYTKNINSTIKSPVMVWIHGGSFKEGSGNDDWYGPDFLLQKDVILVTINYRLGVLGFLNLEDEVATGNQGLKDQILALKWVRNNIENFGGDSRNVTIFGESAGGGSAHYIAISPLGKGLFDKIICQSGVALTSWACLSLNPKKYADKLCEHLGNPTTNPKEMVEFLKTIDVKKLIEAQDKILTKEERIQIVFPFAPGVDVKSKNPFMPVHPKIAAQKGVQKPFLLGYNSREGIFALHVLKEEMKDLFSTPKEKFVKLLHPNFVNIIREKYNLEPNDLRRLYLNDDELSENNFSKYMDLIEDMYFIEGIHRVVQIQVEKSSTPTYLYQYSYDKTLSPFKKIIQTDYKGACHVDDLQHLFPSEIFSWIAEPMEEGSYSYKVMQQMVQLWVNFATTGTPTPDLNDIVPFRWQPVSDGRVLRYFNICEDPKMAKTLSLMERYSAHKFRSDE